MRLLQGYALAVTLLMVWSCALAGDAPNRRDKEHVDPGHGLDTALSSEFDVLPTKSTRLTYLVCNRANQALVFRWSKPGFESGLDNALKSQTCAVYQREVPKAKEQPQDADILYFQSGQPFAAKAFVADETFQDKVASSWTTLLRHIGLGEPYKQPDKRLDVQVIVYDKGSYGMLHDVSWSPQLNAVALKIAATDEKTRTDIALQLQRQPALANSSTVVSAVQMKPLVSSRDANRLSALFEEVGSFVRLEARRDQPHHAQIMLPPTAKVSTQPLLVLDSDKRVVWLVRYTTGAPE